MRRGSLAAWLFGLALVPALAGSARADDLDLPRGDLKRPDTFAGVAGEPGSGNPLDGARPAQPGRLSAPLPKRARSPEEAKAVDELEVLFHRYKRASTATESSLRDLLVIQAVAGRERLANYYEGEIRTRRAKARVLRSKAVARYEEFVRLHPDDPVWTPEILLRLGELQFEAADERYRRQEEAWEKELAAYTEAEEAGKAVGDSPPAPAREFGDAIANFRRVGERFPNYPNADAALYMMGYLLLEMEQFDASRQAFLALGCKNRFEVPTTDASNVVPSYKIEATDYGEDCVPANPESRYLDEAWLRVGEVHYDLDELGPALAAYSRAARDTESPFYDEALIRMAWTLYLQRKFRKAVEKLDEFVRYADAVKGTPKASGAVEFRDDAVKYIAKSYVEPDWDLDGFPDKISGIKRLDMDYRERKSEPHVPEIYSALGDLLAFQTDFQEAIEIWELVLKRYPNTRTAPDVQLKILQAWLQLQEPAKSSAARDKLATSYLRGTPWFYANEDDPDALERAMDLAEDALVAAALEHHEKAQEARLADDMETARAEYLIAARAYDAYLARFPDTPNSYEYRFQFADSLYYSDEFARAAEEFEQVRDSNLDNRLQKDSAEGVIFAREKILEGLQASGKLTVPEMPKDGVEGPFDARELPVEVAALQSAYDAFVEVFPSSEDTPAYRYEAAALSQRYNRFEESEPRFVTVLDEHCDDDVSINAGFAIIDAHVVRGDLAGTREWTEKLAGMGCGSGEAGAKFAGQLRTIGNAVRFQEATLLFEAEEFEAAADRYVALVDEAPDDPNSDKALNNAAVAYEKIGRFASASRTYERIYTKYPDSEFADDALLRTGFNHARFFEFEQAVKKYLVLAEDERYADSEFRLVALKNAASLMENLQDYPRASGLYSEWSAKSTEPVDKAEGAFQSAKVLSKTKDYRGTIAAFESYLRTYGSQPDQAERSVEAYLRMGQAYAAQGKRKQAEKAYRDCVAQFESRGLKPATDAADYPAEAQFLLAEYALEDVLDVKLKGRGKALEKEVKRLFDRVVVAAGMYDAVFPFRRLEWTLAGMFRRGFAFEDVGEKIRTAPTPKGLVEYSEAWFAYQDIVANEAQRFEDKAIVLYEETVKRSAEFKINTEFTKRARERLNQYKPDEYPLLRDPALDMQVEDLR